MNEFRFRDNILEVTFDDPATQNALTLDKVTEIFAKIEEQPVRGLLVRAHGPVFCSGGNLREHAQLKNRSEGLEINRQLRKKLDELYRWPIAKGAIVDGFCFGGGTEFLSVLDFVIATPRSVFGLWQRRVGLSFGWGGRERLTHRLGKSVLHQLFTSAESLGAWKAQQLGLVDTVELRDAAEEAVQRWLHGATRWAPETLVSHTRHVDEVKAFEELWWEPEHQKALTKFRR